MNTKRFFTLLLMLMMVLALTPAREVKAEGEGCPECGEVGKLYRITESYYWYQCTNYQCGQKYYSVAHSGGTATCTEKAKCAICGEEYGDFGHSGGTATCTEKAKCETCGQEYGSALGHSWDPNWSYDENGHYHKCLNDGCTTKKDEAAHAGGTATCQDKAVCEICKQAYGELDTVNGHDLIDHPAQAPTCTAIGWDAYQTCSQCDYTTYVEKPALNHDWITDEAVAPTCTETGLTEGKHCSRCPEKVAQEVVPALGHDWITDPAVAPTCTETGLTEGKHCSRCPEKVEQKEVPAKGHDWDDGVVTLEPTCTAAGVKTFTCRNDSGHTYTEPVPALGHDYHQTDRTILRIYYRCDRCKGRGWRDNYRDENRIAGLLLDEAGAELSYESTVTRPEGRLVLTLTPETAEGAACLMLRADEVAQWQAQGLQEVVLAYGDGRLTIDLNEMGPGWFAGLEGIDGYAFTLAPAEGGLSVKVEALTGEARTEAESLSGLTLTLGEATLPVTANGVYTFAA